MASAETEQSANANSYGYDPQMLRNYVHASAMYWPAFDPASRFVIFLISTVSKKQL